MAYDDVGEVGDCVARLLASSVRLPARRTVHVVLERPIVSIRNGNGQVAVVARRQSGYFLTHVEGLAYPLVNGESIGLGAHVLRDNDLIELAGTIIQFSLDH